MTRGWRKEVEKSEPRTFAMYFRLYGYDLIQLITINEIPYMYRGNRFSHLKPNVVTLSYIRSCNFIIICWNNIRLHKLVQCFFLVLHNLFGIDPSVKANLIRIMHGILCLLTREYKKKQDVWTFHFSAKFIPFNAAFVKIVIISLVPSIHWTSFDYPLTSYVHPVCLYFFRCNR